MRACIPCALIRMYRLAGRPSSAVTPQPSALMAAWTGRGTMLADSRAAKGKVLILPIFLVPLDATLSIAPEKAMVCWGPDACRSPCDRFGRDRAYGPGRNTRRRGCLLAKLRHLPCRSRQRTRAVA